MHQSIHYPPIHSVRLTYLSVSMYHTITNLLIAKVCREVHVYRQAETETPCNKETEK